VDPAIAIGSARAAALASRTHGTTTSMPTQNANSDAMKISAPWVSLLSTSFVGILSCLYLAFHWGGTPLRVAIGIGVLVASIAHFYELRKGKTKGVGDSPAMRRRLQTIELAFGLVTACALVTLSR